MRRGLIALLFLIWIAAIIWRLGDLQIARHHHYRARAEAQRQQTITLSPLRGPILDRRGLELARSSDSDSLAADARQLRDPEKIARTLAPLIGERAGELLKKLTSARGFVWLRRKLDFEAAQRVSREVERHQLDGVRLVKEPQRYYPNGPLAAHLLGYVDIDEKGIAGLELTHDRYLRGQPGQLWLAADARRRAYDRHDRPAASGAQAVITLDAALQHKVEALLEEARRATQARSASAIVLDPQTGEILALANAPSFDPNARPKRSGEEEGFMRRNRALTDIYEPGSVFKTVTYSAAIEEGLVQPEDKIDCLNGQITLSGRTIHDTHAYGLLTVAEALAKSSNMGAIQLALRVGKERLVDYMARFGFGRKTGVDMPGEENGLVHPVSRWHGSSIGSIAIGQEVGVTALQVVAMMAAIANRGVWVQPHLVKRVIAPDGRLLYEAKPETRRVISEQTALTMASMLEGVVTRGTARRAVQLAGYDAAGKTGTAQKVDVATRRYSRSKFVASFAGFVPATNPRFAIVVTLDEPIGLHQGGQVSAPVFNAIAEAALVDYGVTPGSEAFREMVARAQQSDRAQGSSHESGAKSSEPEAVPGRGEALVSSQLVAATLKVEPGVMPDFHGRGVRAVMRACADLDLKLKVIGSGLAARQVPAPGARVKPGEICQVEFQ
jgi:cell division protein FtsI (penicillin-binding protein 3)